MKKNIVITILAVLVVGLGCTLGYVLLNKDNNAGKNSSNENNSSQKVEESKIDVAYARELVYKYAPIGGLGDSRRSTLLNEGLTEEAKLALAIDYATPTSINYTCEEAFPDATKENTGYRIVRGKFNGVCYPDDPNSNYRDQYSYDSVNASYKNLFGEELSAPKTDMGGLSYSVGIYAFSSKYDAYIEVSCECGGAESGSKKSYLEVKQVKKDGEELTVDMGYIFLTSAEEPDDNSNYVGKINGQEVNFNKIEVEDKEVFLSKYLDKLDTYRFEFTYKDKTYKLVSIKKI